MTATMIVSSQRKCGSSCRFRRCHVKAFCCGTRRFPDLGTSKITKTPTNVSPLPCLGRFHWLPRPYAFRSSWQSSSDLFPPKGDSRICTLQKRPASLLTLCYPAEMGAAGLGEGLVTSGCPGLAFPVSGPAGKWMWHRAGVGIRSLSSAGAASSRNISQIARSCVDGEIC